MNLYDLIYNFISRNIFLNSSYLGDWVFGLSSGDGGESVYITLFDWLSHTLTIIILVLFVVALIKLVIWVFKLGANIVRIR